MAPKSKVAAPTPRKRTRNDLHDDVSGAMPGSKKSRQAKAQNHGDSASNDDDKDFVVVTGPPIAWKEIYAPSGEHKLSRHVGDVYIQLAANEKHCFWASSKVLKATTHWYTLQTIPHEVGAQRDPKEHRANTFGAKAFFKLKPSKSSPIGELRPMTISSTSKAPESIFAQPRVDHEDSKDDFKFNEKKSMNMAVVVDTPDATTGALTNTVAPTASPFTDEVLAAWRNFFLVTHGQQIQFPATTSEKLRDAELILQIAEKKGSLAICRNAVANALVGCGNELFAHIAAQPERYLVVGAFLKNSMIFSEAVTHFVGKTICSAHAYKDIEDLGLPYNLGELVSALRMDLFQALSSLREKLLIDYSRPWPTQEPYTWLATKVWQQKIAEDFEACFKGAKDFRTFLLSLKWTEYTIEEHHYTQIILGDRFSEVMEQEASAYNAARADFDAQVQNGIKGLLEQHDISSRMGAYHDWLTCTMVDHSKLPFSDSAWRYSDDSEAENGS